MPVVPIDDEGHYLYYEDTGPPSDSVYTTLILVHGTAFHGPIFRRMLPFAFQYQLRIVVVNRRDYPGSSPYTEEDLDQLRRNDSDAHADFARARASEFARFIEWFAENERIPKASIDWKHGGVVLLAWSAGNAFTLPLLAYADSIHKRTRGAIEPYLRSLIVFDAPRWVVGPTVLGHNLGPLTDESLSPEERTRLFNEWVSAYYTHKSLTSRNISDLQLTPIEGPRKSTIQTMSAEDEQETTYYPAVLRSEVGTRLGDPSIYSERIRRALFDDGLAKYLPRCAVDIIWCENSTWVVVDAVWNFQIAREKADEEGVTGRPMKITMMPGVNHFPHWEEPESTVKFFADVVNT